MGEPHRFQGLARRRHRPAEDVAGEGEVLLCREGTFQGIAVADEVERLGKGPLPYALGADRTFVWPQLSGEDRKQARLAGAVAAGDDERLPFAERERQALENEPPRAAA